MTYIITIYIILISFLNSIVKSIRPIAYSTTALMILLFGGITNCADYHTFESFYGFIGLNGVSAHGSNEIGFSLLIYLGNKLNLSYQLFRTLFGFCGLFLLQKTAFDFSKKYSMVLLLYILYPFMLDVIQFQNFLSSSIVIYSIRFLIYGTRKGYIKYLVLILLAASIHFSALFFIPLIFFRKIQIPHLVRITLFSLPILVALTNTQLIPDLVNNVVSDEFMVTISAYFQKANWGFLLLWGRQLGIFIITYMCYKIIIGSELNDKSKLFGELVIKINLYLIIICFPLLIFDGNFFRLLRPLLFLNYIIISQALFINFKKGLAYSVMAICLVLFYFGMDVLTESNILTVLIPFFESNKFI